MKQQNCFSKAERRSIANNQFLFVRMSGTEAHVTSPSTLDDWIISKQDGYVILYHRHPGTLSFHEHRRFRSTDGAIREIHAHDAYMIRKSSIS